MMEQSVECPVEGCDFAGSPESVTQHYTATSDDSHPGGLTEYFQKLGEVDPVEESAESGSEPVEDSEEAVSVPVETDSEGGEQLGGQGPSSRAILLATVLFGLVVLSRVVGSSESDQANQGTEGEQEPDEQGSEAGVWEVW
jgi:ABC-type Na+ efflux pump permease subunit